jgi:small-conductance mechanosensitive channel
MIQDLMQLPIWDAVYFGNSVFDYAIMLVSFLVLFLIIESIRNFALDHLRRLAEKTATELDDAFIKIIGGMHSSFYAFLAVYIASRSLSMSGFIEKLFTAVLVIWATYQIIAAVEIFIDHMVTARAKKSKAGDGGNAAMHLVSISVKTLIWVFGLLTALSNLGVNVTSLIAGLGIGGVAVALAAQNILGDLFSSFAIYFDQPFRIGDTIKMGEIIGTVEKIGMKTTRIRAMQGEEIIVPNREIAGARIQNFKKMKERRVVFTFGVPYDTDDTKLSEISKWVKEIIANEPNTRFDRAHFKEFGIFALDFEAVYFVTSPDYLVHMNARQNINLAIRKKFTEEHVNMAYATGAVRAPNG